MPLGPGTVDISTTGTVRTATSAATLTTALNASVAGDTVSCTGSFGNVTIPRSIGSGFIRIVPSSAGAATFGRVNLTSAQGLDFRGINLTDEVYYSASTRIRWRGGTSNLVTHIPTGHNVRAGCSDLVIEDVTVIDADCSFYFYADRDSTASDNITVSRVRSENVGQDHAFVSRGTNLVIEDFEFYGHTDTTEHSDGIQIVGGKDVTARRGHIWNDRAFRDAATDNNDHGVIANYDPAEVGPSGTPGRVPERITLENLLIHDQTAHGITVAGCLGMSVRNCTVYDNGAGGTDLALSVAPDAGNTINGLVLVNNVFNRTSISGASITTNTHNFVADGSGPSGTAELTGDPGFVDSAAQDYNLTALSQNVSSGSTSGGAVLDIDQVARPATPSRGAIEYVTADPDPDPDPPPPPVGGQPDTIPPAFHPGTNHVWSMWSRDEDYALDRALPIMSARMVLRHLGVSKAVVTTPYSEAVYDSLGPSRGVVLYRDGQQLFSGLVEALDLDWDAESGRTLIKAECVGDEQHLADRLVFPDPLRAADDQTVNDYWTYAGVASTAMRQLISDQAGPTCRVDRRIPGIVLGADPGVGLSRTWTALLTTVLEQLTIMSVASGENLGIRTSTGSSTLTVEVVEPRDSEVKFSVEFGNVTGLTYRLAAPKLTDALSAGQGDLHLRLRKYTTTASALALSWGRQIWSYLDRRDTADVGELSKTNDDALADGDATVSLAATLTDSQAATYRRDWDLGDVVTAYVRVPGQTSAVATVTDVVREIAIDVDADGVEKIRPAIGSYDAKAAIPTPTQQQLAHVREGLAGLIARK